MPSINTPPTKSAFINPCANTSNPLALLNLDGLNPINKGPINGSQLSISDITVRSMVYGNSNSATTHMKTLDVIVTPTPPTTDLNYNPDYVTYQVCTANNSKNCVTASGAFRHQFLLDSSFDNTPLLIKASACVEASRNIGNNPCSPPTTTTYVIQIGSNPDIQGTWKDRETLENSAADDVKKIVALSQDYLSQMQSPQSQYELGLLQKEGSTQVTTIQTWMFFAKQFVSAPSELTEMLTTDTFENGYLAMENELYPDPNDPNNASMSLNLADTTSNCPTPSTSTSSSSSSSSSGSTSDSSSSGGASSGSTDPNAQGPVLFDPNTGWANNNGGTVSATGADTSSQSALNAAKAGAPFVIIAALVWLTWRAIGTYSMSSRMKSYFSPANAETEVWVTPDDGKTWTKMKNKDLKTGEIMKYETNGRVSIKMGSGKQSVTYQVNTKKPDLNNVFDSAGKIKSEVILNKPPAGGLQTIDDIIMGKLAAKDAKGVGKPFVYFDNDTITVFDGTVVSTYKVKVPAVPAVNSIADFNRKDLNAQIHLVTSEGKYLKSAWADFAFLTRKVPFKMGTSPVMDAVSHAWDSLLPTVKGDTAFERIGNFAGELKPTTRKWWSAALFVSALVASITLLTSTNLDDGTSSYQVQNIQADYMSKLSPLMDDLVRIRDLVRTNKDVMDLQITDLN